MRNEKGQFVKGHSLGKRFEPGHKPWNTGIKKRTNSGRTHFTTEKVSGANNNRWNGGKKRDGYGYIHIRCKDHPNASSTGYVREHRLVMEAKLGRYLNAGEVVHHINGIRDDNTPDNLELYKNHSEHMRDHNATQ